MMKCRKCGRRVKDGASLFRVNEKGVEGIWECEKCVDWGKLDPVVVMVDNAISGGKTQ